MKRAPSLGQRVAFAEFVQYVTPSQLINSAYTADVLDIHPYAASTKLCAWCRYGWLERVRKGVFRRVPGLALPPPMTTRRHVMRLLRLHGPLSVRQLHAMAGRRCMPKSIANELSELYCLGKVQRVRRGVYAIKEVSRG